MLCSTVLFFLPALAGGGRSSGAALGGPRLCSERRSHSSWIRREVASEDSASSLPHRASLSLPRTWNLEGAREESGGAGDGQLNSFPEEPGKRLKPV